MEEKGRLGNIKLPHFTEIMCLEVIKYFYLINQKINCLLAPILLTERDAKNIDQVIDFQFQAFLLFCVFIYEKYTVMCSN